MSYDKPWIPLREVCSLYGVTYETAKNKIHAGDFEVPVYKMGKQWVVDKVVHAEFFAGKREAGLRALKSTTSG